VQKSRVDTFYENTAETWVGLPDKTVYSFGTFYPQSAEGTQDVLYTEGHPFHLLGKDSGDIGGNFVVVRREYEGHSPLFFNRSVNNDTNPFASNISTRYYAKTDNVSDADFPSPLFASDYELDAKGSTAISNVIPTNPLNGLVVSLGELRQEGIPALIGANTWKARTLRAREAGGEYLNYQFGWLPLVSDIRSVADTVRRSDEIIRQYEAQSGKLLHRQYTFPTSREVTNSEQTGVYPSPTEQFSHWSSSGQRIMFLTEMEETWFSGAFTFHLPPQGTRARDLAIARKLWGTELTPEVVWNLTPWSWAADWVTNIGDVLHNVSRFSQDGLVMPYGYIMRRKTRKVEYQLRGARTKYKNLPVDCRQVFTTTVKQRRKATPFGFGLDPALDFTSRQWSILVALGLSRGTDGMKFG